MDPARQRHFVCGACLALALIVAGETAWGQAPSAPARSLERAAAMIQARAFEQAAAMLRELLSVDSGNRDAKELLAFSLESMGDLEGERQVRAALAAESPGDPRLQADYGRVLERSGDQTGALRAYRRARELSGGRAPELDAAIERMRGRTALEVGAPLAFVSDPDATASSAQTGAAVPLGSRHHLSIVATRGIARARIGPAATASDALALTLVRRHAAGASWALGPRVHLVSPRSTRQSDLGVGGAIEGRVPLGPSLEAEGRAEVEAPWDEAAVATLHGGRSTAAEGRLYIHGFSRRLLLQAGARSRQLSILASGPDPTRRAESRQSLWFAGADAVLWRNPGACLPGEMIDDALIAPAGLSSAITLAYRHYDLSTRTTPEFAAVIGLVPRGSVDEASIATIVAIPRSRAGLELRAGLARDSERRARMWRAGGSLIWAPTPSTRFALGYEGATEFVSGLVGHRRAGRMSFHVDL